MSVSLETLMLLAPALVAGAIISLAHVPLGADVLKRGIIFLDLAVAQFAALGMTTFHIFIDNEDMSPELAAIGSLFFGLVFALASSLGLYYLEKRAGKYHEALIGCTFVFAASFGILLMAGNPHGGDEMKDIMAGQILWITWDDLAIYGPVFLITASIWHYFKLSRQSLFYVLFALTIPFSVKLAGVYLVFASLILPALATVNLQSHRHITAYALSVLSFATGLAVSYIFDAPSGPAIVLTMFVACFSFKIRYQYKNSKAEE